MQNFVKTSTILKSIDGKNLCNDMIKGFKSIDELSPDRSKQLENASKDNKCWIYHSETHQGVKSMFGKVRDASNCDEQEKKFAVKRNFIVKGIVFNDNYTVEDGVQEIKMQMKFQALGLAPKIHDAFVCNSSVANKDETSNESFDTLFLVMERKEITVKELFTKLLPRTFFENPDSFIIYKKKRCNILTVLYYYIRLAIEKAEKHGLQHNDLHLGNLMFDIPRESVQFLYTLKKVPKTRYEDAFDSLAFSSFEKIDAFFNFKSVQFIDFGHASELDEENEGDLEYVSSLLTHEYINNELRRK
jgi:hypothetical protein